MSNVEFPEEQAFMASQKRAFDTPLQNSRLANLLIRAGIAKDAKGVNIAFLGIVFIAVAITVAVLFLSDTGSSSDANSVKVDAAMIPTGP